MKGILFPVLMSASALAPLSACNETFVNECDDPAIRAQYNAADQKAIEVPICIHTVYPDEASKDSLEVEGTEEVESTDDAYSRSYIEYVNAYMAGYDPVYATAETAYIAEGEQNRADTNIGLYEFAPRDIIVDDYWGHADDYSDSDPAGQKVRHNLAASNNTEGCMNLYIIQSGVSSLDKFGYATTPNNSPQDSYIIFWGSGNSQLAHELGHTLGLLHTDEPNGDHLNDTPYDPGEDYCNVVPDGTGGSVGVCDAPYEEYGPGLPWNNIMAPYGWGYSFTEQQIERMHCTWSRHEDDIYSGI
jgi:hypothetical protein